MKTTPTNPGLWKLISRLLVFVLINACMNRDKRNK